MKIIILEENEVFFEGEVQKSLTANGGWNTKYVVVTKGKLQLYSFIYQYRYEDEKYYRNLLNGMETPSLFRKILKPNSTSHRTIGKFYSY